MLLFAFFTYFPNPPFFFLIFFIGNCLLFPNSNYVIGLGCETHVLSFEKIQQVIVPHLLVYSLWYVRVSDIHKYCNEKHYSKKYYSTYNAHIKGSK